MLFCRWFFGESLFAGFFICRMAMLSASRMRVTGIYSHELGSWAVGCATYLPSLFFAPSAWRRAAGTPQGGTSGAEDFFFFGGGGT